MAETIISTTQKNPKAPQAKDLKEQPLTLQ